MSDFAVGDDVRIYMFQRWRDGRVVRVAPTRVLVEYPTPKGVKTRRQTWFRKTEARRV